MHSVRTAAFTLASVLGTLVLACAHAPYAMTVTTERPLKPRAENCGFELLSFPPIGNYEEVGRIRPTGRRVDGADALKAAIVDEVCRVGGDVVVAETDGDGGYTLGIVLRKVQ